MGALEEYFAGLDNEPMPEGGPTWRQCAEMMRASPLERLFPARRDEMQRRFLEDRVKDWEARLWGVPDGR